MKDLKLLVWLTQLGMSVAVPLAGFILLALWLYEDCNWGSWVLFAGIGLGLYSAFEGLRASLKTMALMSKEKKEDPPPVSYNEHC